MPQRWQMRIAGALPVGIDESASSWCFVKLGSSVEIARPVVVSEKGDSRVSRKWERLALRGSMLSWPGVRSGVCPGALSACALVSALEAVWLCPAGELTVRRRSDSSR